MTKKNENIHSFIIEEEYRRTKAKQNDREDFSRKAVTPMLAKSVVQKLEGMHPTFSVIEELESLQIVKEAGQIDHQQSEELPNTPDILDLVESFQKVRTEEQRLLEIKQQILAKQHDLQNKIVKEIEKKKATIANLTSEIPDLQNRIKNLRQALGVDIYK
jgi:hypothetical protein